MRNTTYGKKKEDYEIGQHIRVLPKLKKDIKAFEGRIEAMNAATVIIKPDVRPHEGYRIMIPWVDVKLGRYKMILDPCADVQTDKSGHIVL